MQLLSKQLNGEQFMSDRTKEILEALSFVAILVILIFCLELPYGS